MKNPVFESTRFLIEDPKYVTINQEKIERVSEKFASQGLKIPSWDYDIFPEKNDESTIDFFMLLNTINFAFRDFDTKKKYTINYKGNEWRGSQGMIGALKRAIEEGYPLLEGDYLKDVTKEEAAHIFRGNFEIPMLGERVNIFREVGEVLCDKYDGHFYNLVRASNHKLFDDGDGLIERLVSDFKSFDDSVRVDGHHAKFYKRAQLAPGMLYGRFRNNEAFKVEDIDKLSAFADYVLPKSLRDVGVIEYEDSLAQRVDKQVLIPAKSREEMEIRASTIHACRDIQEKMNSMLGDGKVNALHIDYKLWSESRNLPEPDPHPHHLTRTIAY